MAANQQISKSVLITGLVFIFIGAILLFDRLGIWRLSDLIFTWWPLILIAFGIKILISKNVAQNNKMKFNRFAPYNFSETVQPDGTSKVYESRSFGDINRRITAKKFTGATFFCFAGDIEIDAREMQLAEGRWQMNIDGIFGDIHLRLPHDLPVLIRGKCTAGDIVIRDMKSSGLFVHRSVASESFKNSPTQLVVSTLLLFGDIKVE